MKCHYIQDEIAGKVLIPGCISAAVWGIEECTCEHIETYNTDNATILKLRARIKELEAEVNRLNRKLANP